MLEKIIGVVDLFGHWGYLVIFLAAFLESSAFMGLIVPGESIVVLAGILASQGYLDIVDCILVISLGAVAGDSAGYAIGKRFGAGYFMKRRKLFFLKEKHVEKTREYFRRHGGKTIFFGRFIGLLRAMAPFVAGMSSMPYRTFFIYNASGGIIWAVCFTLLGYFFAQSWQVIERWSGRAGVFVFFVLVVLSFFVYLYRLAVKRQSEIHEWFTGVCASIASSSFVMGFKRRHPVAVSFVYERLSPKNYLGLHLTVGLLVSGVFVWIFGGITEDILTGDPLVVVDRWVLVNITHFRTPLVTDFMLAVIRLGGVLAILLGSLVVALCLIYKRRLDYLASYFAAITGGGVLVAVLQAAVHRERPVSETMLVEGWSFPSGHAMMSVIFFGMVVYFIVRNIRSWNQRVFTVTAVAFTIFLIGLSRIYLQVHYLSDILAGYVGGLFWLSICITGLEVYRKRGEGRGRTA